MKSKLLLLPLILLCACLPETNQPQTGSRWGEILNPSAEDVASSEVRHWIADRGNHVGIHMYDHQAQEGKKSLTIYATQAKFGRWYSKVNLKPWTVYEFTGWIKTKQILPERGEGAGFHLGAYGREFTLLTEPQYLTGSHDWTEIKFQFDTGNQDCAVLECLINYGGKATGQAWFDNINLREVKTETLSPEISLDLSQEGTVMQDYVYGQFIEHLGKCIYGGIWAEVLDDRKFFYPPNHANSPWKVAGNIAGFSMDKNQAYVGEHSTTLAVGNERVELHQDGLGIKENMGYSGRIVLKATGDVSLDLSLRWGDAPEQASNMTIDHLPDGFTTFPISFKSTVHHQNATLVLRPEGKGQIWIGTLSLMPDDHTEGFRTDVLELLKELNSPVYRWPGGNFVSGYDWKDGIGDPDMRPPRKNPAWTGVEHNDVGIHEFMRFCELLKTEAYIAVNAGLGGAEEARKQVEYCIGATETPMGKWRSENGHPEPWTIEWWSVGNEMYGGWQLGHMPTEKFAQKHNEFADAMWSVNPDIKLVAVGNPGPWNEMILANCADRMDYISEHFYKQDWHGGGLMTHIRQIPDAIRERAEIHREYRNSIPGLAEKDIQICLDEWNYWYGPHIYGELGTRYFMRDALGVAAGINEFSKQSDLIYMANYAQTVNVIGAIKATNTQSVMAATGQALTMYRKYFGTIPIAFTGDVRPLDIAATLTADRKYLCVSLVNLSWSSHQVKIDFDADFKYSDMEVYTLKAVSDMAYNVPGQEKTVTIEEQQGLSFNGTLAISPVEARIYRFKLEAN